MTGGLEAQEGVFEHPAYAKMTVSIARRVQKDGKVTERYLLVTASPRIWNFVVDLTHVHEEIFMAEIISPPPRERSKWGRRSLSDQRAVTVDVQAQQERKGAEFWH